LAVSGCASALSSFQPAHVGPKGQVRAEVGSDVAIPTATIASSLDAAKTLASAARTRELSEAEKTELFKAGLNLALNAPSLVNHVGITYNPADQWEVGLRYAGSAWRLGGRRQLLTQTTDGTDLSVGVGVSRATYEFPISDIIDVVRLNDFERWNIDVPITAGWQGPAHRIWLGPRLAYMHHSASMTIQVPGDPTGVAEDDVASSEGDGFFVGALAGAAVGYRWLFVAAELSIVRLLGDAELNVFGRTTSADTSSWIITPGLALMGEF
ncbi:MAG TPA: hypothetical protein VGG33_06735, partial [Polyangia bacterium]